LINDMPWQSQGGGGGGPWGGGGGGGQGPWGRGPSPGNQGGPPDLEEMLRRGQDRMKQYIPGGFGNGRTVGIVAGIIVAIWLVSGTYQVQPNEVGVPLIFGRVQPIATPGLHWNWPAPIGDVLKPSVTAVNTVEVGIGNQMEESLMLTGDQNIIKVAFSVQWQISDAEKFLFNIQDYQGTIKGVAESAMREIIGQTPFDRAITTGRGEIEPEVHQLMQRMLDEYGAGVIITQVALQPVEPPPQVDEAFRDVKAAEQDRERASNEAQAYANKRTLEAEGEARRIVLNAEAYKAQKIAQASGEAQRFTAVYEQYKASPDITERRIYLETMERIMGGLDKVLMDNNSSSGSVPYLSLNELIKRLPQSSTSKPNSETGAVPAVPGSGQPAVGVSQ
jgi:membrane protease subunit HflK